MMKYNKFLIAIIGLLLLLGCKKNSEREAYQAAIDSLNTVIASMESSTASETNHWFNDAVDGKQLVKYGIAQPEEYVVKQFSERTDLFPIKAVLGGTMRFSKVQVLGNKWLIADFDDGHVGGRAIYSYHLKDGKLMFKIMDFVSF
ncbi:MAG: hypothetical protein GX102_09165 [Porphyromonadaceae bacterium]|nr:hypothetical protein [Porphyromonadaceae bacterium]